MKQLIVPIAIIVALIAVFVIVDRKEFSRHDDVQTIQSESSTINRKPAVSVPETKPKSDLKPAVETKPIETKPVAENKPVTDPKPVTEAKPKTDAKPSEKKTVAETKNPEVKPVTEIKPVETKPVAKTKPVDPKPVAQTKPEEKVKPAAVPVVTAEEAKQLNVFASFLCEGIVNNTITVVEGTIVERSNLPDPALSDYPNCRFTAHLRGNSIRSGNSCPQEIALSIEGFKNFHILTNDNIKAGDKVACTIVPFATLPQEYQSTQQADDLELFLLENYYVIEIKTISSFSDKEPLFPTSGIFFSDKKTDNYLSIFERAINPPIPESVKEAQRISINKDIERMNDLLDGYDKEKMDILNVRFSKVWNNEMAKDTPGYNRIGNIVWRNIDNSFWALPSNYIFLSSPQIINKRTMDCFLSLKDACEANGVQLIVSLVPDLYVISSRVINKEFHDIPDLQTASFVKQFSEAGIEAIYASDKIIQNYNKYPFAFFFPSDGHPGDTTQDCLSELLIERCKRYNIPQELDSTLFSTKMDNTLTYRYPKPFLFPQNCDIGSNSEGDIYNCLHIFYNNERVAKDKNASVMIIGNSYMVTPMPSSPEALPSFMMYKSLFKVDAHFMNGYGPFSEQLIRLLLSPETYLKNKRVLIMQFGVGHLKAVSSNGIMVDISHLDRARSLHQKQLQNR